MKQQTKTKQTKGESMSYDRKFKQKEEKPDIKKMLRYTVKKVLWLVNYALSFSKKDSGKEIGIKLLACFVILQSISLSFFMLSSLLNIILMNPILTVGFLIFLSVFFFKKEIKSFINPKGMKGLKTS